MKRPEVVIFPQDKLLRCLLLPREKNDKSRFLPEAEYTLANWKLLERDLHRLAQDNEVSGIESSPYGVKYEVRGTLIGPSGRTLQVVTVWIRREATGGTVFVTLFPDREVA